MAETVDHPQHYGGDVPHEVYKCLRAWGLESDALIWNAVKYLSRAGKKSEETKVEDLKKAIWYINCRITQLEGASEDSTALREDHGAGTSGERSHED